MNTLAEKIRRRTFVLTAELATPKGVDLTALFAKAEALRGVVDAINLTESPRARMAIEPKSVARLLLERGVEPIVQFTARDRNRIAIQADILGAAALGVSNVVFMTGDDPRNGDHPDAKPVFDLNTVQMLQAAHALNAGRDLAGGALNGAPSLFIGATANPGAADLETEIANVRAKIAAGAVFLQTQAVYDIAVLRRFIDALDADVAVLVGVIPLKSARMARWMNDNLPGVRAPDALIERMEAAAGDAQAEVLAGIESVAEIMRAVQPYCAGVHLMTMGWEQHIPAMLRASGLSLGGRETPALGVSGL